jgi:multidrug transporter EmrE-like cation transporter
MKLVHAVLAFALVANAVANILIKEGMRDKNPNLSDIVGTLKIMLLNPPLLAGLLFFGLALGAYSYVLSQIKLSVAYPIMTSVGFLIVVSYSFFKLNENITYLQMGGLALILAGVWMVATNM